ncbi:MAG: serine/threonine protein kinase [Planctomycetia bacterium]|nr:serine/threonine protein kinase [Planctomycetia bacterium]MCC7316853.1 serine/threonine protein kinase [Planctomycetota bacterium]
MSDLWRQAKDHFFAALDQPEATRESFVQAHCADPAVRAEVMRLLHLHAHSGEFLQTPIGTAAAAPTAGDVLVGRQLGEFKILRRIGAGGMGVVYEAEQERPHRRVAVKLLRPGFATPSTLRRLEYEAEVLARLQHPGIAHVYAAGTFDLGDGAQPWFAMQLVEGKPLHAYAGDHLQTIPLQLEVLLEICDAVQHAHQRGVVHRDLKPSNILVSDQPRIDETAAAARAHCRPIILDFGVARVIDANLQTTMQTAVGELVGTLGYMSPEQLKGDPADIDARCDVYALGVLGFELLSGKLPHDRKGSSVGEYIRAIEQDDPQRLGIVNPALRGDLDTIFARALEKDPARRYQSAAELAADLRRFLRHEPVHARPATKFYQLRKFARRNRAVVAGTLTTVAALVTGIVMYGLEARQARSAAAASQYEADKALAINNFITNDFLMKLLAAANADKSGHPLPVADLVDQASAQIAVMFADKPLAEAAVRNEVASIYYNLGNFAKAEDQFRQALNLWESKLGPDHADTLKAVNNLGQTVAQQGRSDEAEVLYRRALDGRLRLLGEEDHYTLTSMNNLGNLLGWTGRAEEGEAMLRRTLAIQTRVQGPNHKHTIIMTVNLATQLAGRNKPDEAVILYQKAYDASRETLGADHVTTLITGSRLATGLRAVGRLDEAEKLQVGIVAALARTLGSAHKDVIIARHVLARIYKSMDRPDDAGEQFRLALQGCAENPDVSTTLAADIKKEMNTLAASPPPPTAGNSP